MAAIKIRAVSPLICVFFIGFLCLGRTEAIEVRKGLTCNTSDDCGYNEVCTSTKICAVDLFKWDKDVDNYKLRRGLYLGLGIGIPILVSIIIILSCCCCRCCPLYRCCCCCKGKKKAKQLSTQLTVEQATIAYDNEGNPLLVETAAPTFGYGSTLKGQGEGHGQGQGQGHSQGQGPPPQFQYQYRDNYQYEDDTLPPPPPPSQASVGWAPPVPVGPPGVQIPTNQFQYPGQYVNSNQNFPPPLHYQNTPPPPYFQVEPQPQAPTAPQYSHHNEAPRQN